MSDLIDYAAGTFFLKKESRLKRSFVIKKKHGRGEGGKGGKGGWEMVLNKNPSLNLNFWQ